MKGPKLASIPSTSGFSKTDSCIYSHNPEEVRMIASKKVLGKTRTDWIMINLILYIFQVLIWHLNKNADRIIRLLRDLNDYTTIVYSWQSKNCLNWRCSITFFFIPGPSHKQQKIISVVGRVRSCEYDMCAIGVEVLKIRLFFYEL